MRVVDNFSSGPREHLIPFLNDIELIEGDIRSLTTVYCAVDGVDFVFHGAVLPSVPRRISNHVTARK